MGPSLVERLNRGNTYQGYCGTAVPRSLAVLTQRVAPRSAQRTSAHSRGPPMPADACFNFPFVAVVEAHCASPSENAHAPKTHPQPTPPPPNRRPAGAVRPGTRGAVPARPASLCAAPRPGGRLPQVLGGRVLPLTYVPRTTHAQESPPSFQCPPFEITPHPPLPLSTQCPALGALGCFTSDCL